MGFEKPEEEGRLWCTWQLQLAVDFFVFIPNSGTGNEIEGEV